MLAAFSQIPPLAINSHCFYLQSHAWLIDLIRLVFYIILKNNALTKLPAVWWEEQTGLCPGGYPQPSAGCCTASHTHEICLTSYKYTCTLLLDVFYTSLKCDSYQYLIQQLLYQEDVRFNRVLTDHTTEILTHMVQPVLQITLQPSLYPML